MKYEWTEMTKQEKVTRAEEIIKENDEMYRLMYDDFRDEVKEIKSELDYQLFVHEIFAAEQDFDSWEDFQTTESCTN